MLKKSRIIVGTLLVIGLTSTLAAPAMAQSTNDALDQTFVAQNPDGSSISGAVQIPALTAGSAVTGGGTMAIQFDGQTIYSGGFTATMLKSLTPPSAAGFAPILAETTASLPIFGSFFPVSFTNGPVANAGMVVTAQLSGVQCTYSSGGACVTASVPTGQDLLIYCANARTTLDIGITLTSTVSSDLAVDLLTIPGGTVDVVFPNVTGTSTGSLC